jgi:membrane protease subunit HflK
VLDEYESGVEVLQVQLLRAACAKRRHRRVQRRRSTPAKTPRPPDQQRQPRNGAHHQRSARLPRAASIREATGEAERFIAVHTEYRQAPQVTRDRLYLETMERVYQQRQSDHPGFNAGGAVPYLPLDGMIRRNAPAADAQGGAG